MSIRQLKVRPLNHCSFVAFVAALTICVIATNGQADQPEPLKLKGHPRLWVPAETINNLGDKLHTPYLKTAAARIIQDADWLVDTKPIGRTEGRTNQQGTRAIASHLQTLTSAYVLTREPKYRAAAIKHLANILNWNHISCEANPNTPLENKKFFCLSYGEHAADIALMYDVFRPDITKAEMKVFNDVLDRFYLWQALRAYERNPWWVNKEWSNWNGVCAGGIGMLALAFYDDRPEARKLIPFVEESLGHYFKSYITNGGGNHEGTGYWNYGMHYAMRYLLSYENATGKKHPAFDIPEIGKSLHFPVDFTKITFGDNDGWHPTGMYFMVAKRTNQPEAAMRAATFIMNEVGPAPAPEDRKRLGRTYTGDILYAADFIPTDAQMKKLRAERQAQPEPVARVYENLEWAVIADDSMFPRLRMSARGGSNEIRGHGHLDLLSFKCRINDQTMIDDQKGGIMSVSFTGRGQDLYSRSAAGKSTLFVDGVGTEENVRVKATEIIKADGLLGVRIDGTRAYLPRWRGFIGRTFLLVDSKYWLVVDTAPGHVIESRFHTYAELETGDDWARLKKGDEQMTMQFASIGKSTMQHSRGMPVRPSEQTKIMRWINTGRSRATLNVTALNPGTDMLELKLAEVDAGFDITVTEADGTTRTIQLTANLNIRD
jgi:hypothetical protein